MRHDERHITLEKASDAGIYTVTMWPVDGAAGEISIYVANHFDGEPAGGRFHDYSTANARRQGWATIVSHYRSNGFTVTEDSVVLQGTPPEPPRLAALDAQIRRVTDLNATLELAALAAA